ncbi:MAG TPA: glycosyltransferase family 4 protein [Ignavibacteria bacterium]|nr:glycosyltransferase family 4 protein [Ignavibacteria bacterium]
MNILHLTPDFNYADGRSYYVFLLLKYFKRREHNITLLTNSGDSIDRALKTGATVIQENFLSRKASFLNSVKLLTEITDKNKIDIIHSHHRYYELLTNTAVKTSGRKVKTVFTSLSLVKNRYAVEFKSDRIIAVSNCIREMLINRFNVNPEKISLIPNFADSEELLLQKAGIDNDLKKIKNEVNILSVGRFHKEKDHLTLLRAIDKIKNTGKKRVKLTLVGEGEEKESYINFISERSLNAEIITPQKDLSEYFMNADICILSSVRDPFPGFMLQSGLHKKAFIGTDTDGIGELIREGKNGLLFQKKNSYELATKIDIFIKDKILAEQCGNNLYNNVISKYTEKQVIPEIEELYMQFAINN